MKQIDKFLRDELEFISAQIINASKDEKVNMVDIHFLTGIQMSLQYLITKNNGTKKKA